MLALRLLVGCSFLIALRNRARRIVDPRLLGLLAEARQQLSIKKNILFAETDRLSGPILTGIFRPIIILPHGMARHLSDDQVSHVLSHELVHYKRMDNLSLLLQRLNETLLFFHPIVWLCGIQLRREAERACDDTVVLSIGDSTPYVDSLSAVALLATPHRYKMLLNTFAAAESNISQRMKRLLHMVTQPLSRRGTVAFLCALISMAVFGLPSMGEKSEQGKAELQGKAPADAPESQSPKSEEGRGNARMIGEIQVIREGETGYIAGLEQTNIGGTSRYQNSVIACMAVAAQTIGDDIPFDYLMGLSAASFKLQFDWHVSAPHANVGFNSSLMAYKALGYEVTWKDIRKNDETHMKALRKGIIESIDRGIPVLYNREESSLIVGYIDGGEDFLILPWSSIGMWKTGDEYLKMEDRWPWGIELIRPKAQKPRRMISIVASLRAALEIANTPIYRNEIDGKSSDLPSGFHAYETWIEQVADDMFVEQNIGPWQWQGNWWTYGNLQINRDSASRYLRMIAPEFPEEHRHYLLAAADRYESVSRLLKKGKDPLPPAWATPNAQTAHLWTKEMRQAQADVLRGALSLEREAIAGIERFLAAIGERADGNSRISERGKMTTSELNIDMKPPPNHWGNTFARAMASVLTHLGADISYERVMGLTGVAFILQVDTSGPFIDEELDCAWWPNDAWGFELGLPVLSKAVGRELRHTACDVDAYRSDPAAVYHRTFSPGIEESLGAGIPALVKDGGHCFVVTGIDGGVPPLSGYGTRGKSTQFLQKTIRPDRYPWGLYTIGEKIRVGASAEIDLASLRHIIDLFDEQAQGPDAPKTRFSGRQAWAEWLRLLKGGTGADNNMLIHLRYNRRSAVAYLRDMARRHTGKSVRHLAAAADLYQRSLDDLMAGELPHPGPTKGGREAYTAMIERVSKLETDAIAELRAAAVSIAGGP